MLKGADRLIDRGGVVWGLFPDFCGVIVLLKWTSVYRPTKKTVAVTSSSAGWMSMRDMIK